MRIPRSLAVFSFALTIACSTGGPGPDAGASTCGDGVVDDGEECDGSALADASCMSLGYTSGELACDATCRFARDRCARCGDGVRSGEERCDGDDFGGESCALLGYTTGVLQCTTDCRSVDIARCRPACDDDDDCNVDDRCELGQCRELCAISSECLRGEYCGVNGVCTPGCGIDLDCQADEDCVDGVCTPFEKECSNDPNVCDCPDPSTICRRYRCVPAEPCVTDADCACSDLAIPFCQEINGACIDASP